VSGVFCLVRRDGARARVCVREFAHFVLFRTNLRHDGRHIGRLHFAKLEKGLSFLSPAAVAGTFHCQRRCVCGAHSVRIREGIFSYSSALRPATVAGRRRARSFSQTLAAAGEKEKSSNTSITVP
jgi:hypothetical protein